MKFMVLIKSDPATEEGAEPSEEQFAEMTAYNEAMVNAGIMVAGEGLQPSRKGAKVRFSNGTTTVTDGPFTEAKELIAGFWIIKVESKEEAIEWVKKMPGGDHEVEVRQVFEMEDFGDGYTPEIQAREDALREKVAAQQEDK